MNDDADGQNPSVCLVAVHTGTCPFKSLLKPHSTAVFNMDLVDL